MVTKRIIPATEGKKIHVVRHVEYKLQTEMPKLIIYIYPYITLKQQVLGRTNRLLSLIHPSKSQPWRPRRGGG
jgi:hypothetical protein